MLSLSRPLALTLHFSCSKLFCCKIKAVLLSCSIHVSYPYQHRARQHMDLQFSHTLPSVTTRGRAHTLCPLRHTLWNAAVLRKKPFGVCCWQLPFSEQWTLNTSTACHVCYFPCVCCSTCTVVSLVGLYRWTLTVVLSDHGIAALWATILVGSDPCPLSCYLLQRTLFALLETHTLVFWHCLHPCGARALLPFTFTQAIH